MNLFPARVLSLESGLPPAALTDVLRGVVGDGAATPFSGSVGGGVFVVTRLNEFRSSLMPRVRGRLAPGPGGGTVVRLSLRPQRLVFAFMGIWLFFLGAVALLGLAARSGDPGRRVLAVAAPAGLALGSWSLMISVFAADARWVVEHLLERVPPLRRPPGPDSRPDGGGNQ